MGRRPQAKSQSSVSRPRRRAPRRSRPAQPPWLNLSACAMSFSSLDRSVYRVSSRSGADFIFRFPSRGSALGVFGRLRLLGSLDALDHESARFIRVAPANDLYPLVGFKILVVREEMLDLLDRD